MIGYPLDSHVEFDENNIPVYDRAVSSVPLRKLIKKLFSDGVMPNPSTNMQVAAGTGMNVVVKPGFAICNGCMKLEEEQVALSVRVADSSYARIDTVVLRLDDNDSARSCELAVLTGTPSANPVRPNLTRNKSVWEIGLADIKVSANATSIKNGNITDTRYQASRCGVISSISEFDTTTLYQQIQDDLKEFQENEKTYFAEWFDEIKDQLSTDAAGNLQNQILVERERINNLARMEDGSIVTDAEKEIADVRVDANGITHPTAGDAVREQFNEANEKITKNTEISEEVKAARTVNGKSYKNLGLAINGLCFDVVEAIGGFDHSMLKIINDYMKGKAWNTLNINVGDDISSIKAIRDEVYPVIGTGCFVCKTKVKKYDFIEFKNTWVVENRQNYSDKLVITNKDFVVVKTINFNLLAQEPFVEIEEDGYMYLCSEYYDSTEVLFVLRRKNVTSPLVLEENEANEYLYDSIAGEEALQAILSGRQILVRVPNASGDNYVASYSPVYMYQLPNYENQYLYLFYLKDEKETIDLSAIGAGKIEMPIYGQLKMLLSKTYNADPLK